jgi:hypothetical protein
MLREYNFAGIPIQNSENFRERAEELRSWANVFKDPVAKATMLRNAKFYDDLAEQAAQQNAGHAGTPKLTQE